MSAVSGTGGATSAASALSSTDFLQLLVAQLQNQDPTNPINSQDLVTQLATLNSVQSQTNLTASFSQLLQLEQLTQGSSLIGKTINYTPTNGSPTTGTVSGVTAANGSFVITVGSQQVSLSQINSVK